MLSLPEKERVVDMIDDKLISHAFSVSINKFEDDSYIISFTDISQTIIESNSLRRKATHDKLTGALNREYFDMHIQGIIEEAHPEKLGLIICDIDHFKLVNDTYGHNRGDIILQEFTKVISKSIRESDYLVRWGGEEFIVLIKISDVDSLEKVSEKIDAAELAKYEAAGKPLPEDFLTWEQRRKGMKNVCYQCHTKIYVENFYYQYDNEVHLYNDKFGKPALALMKALKKEGLITPIPFDDKIE